MATQADTSSHLSLKNGMGKIEDPQKLNFFTPPQRLLILLKGRGQPNKESGCYKRGVIRVLLWE